MLNKEGTALLRTFQIEASRRGIFQEYFRLTQYNRYPLYPYVQKMCSVMDRIIKGEAVKAMFWLPPQHLKTTTITETFPSFYMGTFPENPVMLLSYSDNSAKKFGIRNREKMERYGQEIWNLEVSPKRYENKYWELKGHNGKLISNGFKGQITGEGAKLLVIDDPVKNKQEAFSLAKRDSLWNEYSTTIETRVHQGGSKIVIQTRWHKDDLSGRILKNETGWEVYCFPALALGNDILGRQEGEALCPSWMDRTTLLEKKTLLRADFDALYQGNPTLEEGNYFRKLWFKYFREDDEHYICSDGKAFKKSDCWILQTIDAAATISKRSDYTVIMTMIITPDKDILISDIFREKIGGELYESVIGNQYAKHEPLIIGVENKTFGMTIIQQLKKKFPIKACEADTDKLTRSMVAQSRYNVGAIYHRADSFWLDAFERELLEFDSGEHDDQVDCISYGALLVMRKKKVGIG